MDTALAGAPSKPGSRRGPGERAKTIIGAVGAVVATAIAARLVIGPGHLNADALQALVRGSQMFAGDVPDYASAQSAIAAQAASTAPTPHPLLYVLSGLASLGGPDFGYTVMMAIGWLAFGGLICVIYQLGKEVASRAVGLTAAAIVFTSVPVFERAAGANIDISFAALVLAAVLMEVRKPRAGAPVLVVLAIAGLLRPDAWLIAGVYWLYLLPHLTARRRVTHAALVAVAPILWVAFDLAVTGEPLYSLTHTQDGTLALARRTGVAEVPGAFVDHTRNILRAPVIIAALVGIVLALRKAPRARPLIAVGAVGVATFAALGIFQLPLNDRYLVVVVTILPLFAAYAVFGWVSSRNGDGPGRAAWAAFGVAALAVIVLTAPAHLGSATDARDELALRSQVSDDLASIVSDVGHNEVRDCGSVVVADTRPAGILAYNLDIPVRDIQFFEPGIQEGYYFVPQPIVRENFPLDPASVRQGAYKAPSGYSLVAANASWAAYRSASC